MLVSSHVRSSNVVGAFHQRDGLPIFTEDGGHYSFVPDEPPITRKGTLTCSGIAYRYSNGNHIESEHEAKLIIKNLDSEEEFAELEI